MEQATDNNGPMASAASPCRSSTCSSSDGEGGGEEGKEVQRGTDDDRDALLAGLISKHRALSQQGRQQPQQQPQQPQAAGVVATGEGQWGSPQKSFTNVRLSSRSSDGGDLEERLVARGLGGPEQQLEVHHVVDDDWECPWLCNLV